MEGTPIEDLKRKAAASALEHVESGMVLGLGTGSTIAHFLSLLGERILSGDLNDLVGGPTSIRTGREARQAGIELIGLADRDRIDLTVDGADEVTPQLDLIKGMGGALLREKMVAQASDRLIIIADAGKAVDRLGTLSPLPVEVVDWDPATHIKFLESKGASVAMRMMADGPPLRSDNGNLLLDCRFPDGIADADALEAQLRERSGVVESGLFLGMADTAILASADGIQVLHRGT
jgi:ribose 5-phosphate isomerase A